MNCESVFFARCGNGGSYCSRRGRDFLRGDSAGCRFQAAADDIRDVYFKQENPDTTFRWPRCRGDGPGESARDLAGFFMRALDLCDAAGEERPQRR